MTNEPAEAATEAAGEQPERRSAVLAMVNAALAKLTAERRQRQPSAADLTIAELERQLGHPKGALASPLKPVNRSRVPRLATIQTMATALNIDAADLGQAFMTDFIGDGDEKTIHQQRAADIIGELPPALQRLALRQLEALAEHSRGCERAHDAAFLAKDADGSSA
ncbi:hypothetical protein BBK82_10625 [Lentzea guizhouensis]|uniref:Uncharacterized protein n=1 Tax=Lentzea guizhouensis TaxID=1586287 RepID=A0A1B2HFF1_9PSEU|nr:hypothetical protein [Lentzea guizhouensis]ANZ36451.1 hypothetical protein BBK82_10625 [Lentzea guizhouensis]